MVEHLAPRTYQKPGIEGAILKELMTSVSLFGQWSLSEQKMGFPHTPMWLRQTQLRNPILKRAQNYSKHADIQYGSPSLHQSQALSTSEDPTGQSTDHLCMISSGSCQSVSHTRVGVLPLSCWCSTHFFFCHMKTHTTQPIFRYKMFTLHLRSLLEPVSITP